MEQTNYQIFVYGTLRSGFRQPAFEYISRYFSLVCNAKIRGVLFDMETYPAAQPSLEETFVHGELYEIKNESEFNWAIEQLDDYEGLNVEEGERPLFRREICKVYTNEISTVQAWVYWFKGDTTGKNIIASGDALKYLQTKTKAKE